MLSFERRMASHLVPEAIAPCTARASLPLRFESTVVVFGTNIVAWRGVMYLENSRYIWL